MLNASYINTDDHLVKIEFMKWIHICTTFEVNAIIALPKMYHTATTTYVNGEKLFRKSGGKFFA